MNIADIENLSRVSIRIFLGIDNAEGLIYHLQAYVENGSLALIDLSLVTGKLHLFFGIARALRAESTSSLKAKSLAAEIIYQLSSSGNINESAKHFCASSSSKDIAIVTVDQKAVYDVLRSNVGDIFANEVSISDAFESRMASTPLIVKVFKITQTELSVSGLEDAVLTKIAIKDI